MCFDIDGVIGEGNNPLPQAAKAFNLLVNGKGDFLCPIVFLTNSSSRAIEKARTLSRWLNIKVPSTFACSTVPRSECR